MKDLQFEAVHILVVLESNRPAAKGFPFGIQQHVSCVASIIGNGTAATQGSCQDSHIPKIGGSTWSCVHSMRPVASPTVAHHPDCCEVVLRAVYFLATAGL